MQNLYVLHFVATWQKSDSIKLFKKCGFKLVNANSFIIAKIEIVIHVVKNMPGDIRIYVKLKL